MTRTPGPWRTGEQEPTDIHAADNRLVLNAAGDCKDEEDIANAAFIVRACNAHDDLVQALRHNIYRNHHESAACSGCQQARAVLAKVEGEEEGR